MEVKIAKEAIDTWLDIRERANATLEMTLEREQDVAAIIGQKGIVARSIEDDYNCRIDVDKKSLIVTVKGQSESQREAAMSKMKELIESYHNERTTREALAKEQRENIDLNATKDVVNGMEPASTESLIASKNHCIDSNVLGVEEDIKQSQFPTNPVGVGAKSSNKKKKVDASINEGTDAGKSLFAMLTSQD